MKWMLWVIPLTMNKQKERTDMKNKLSFNTNIFIETMRQLRVVGIISAIIMAGITIMRTIALVTDSGKEAVYTFVGSDCAPWLIVSFMLIAPVLMFQAFHFMDKRNSSDFYHSLPHTRGTIFISINLAVLAWVIISILAVIIPTLLSALLFSKHIAIDYVTFLTFTLNNLASCILVCGAISIAKSLSGTILNGIILSGMIIFLPRFVITLFVSTLEANPLLSGFIGNGFTENSLNPVTSIVFSLMQIDTTVDIDAVFTSVLPIIYGVVLGIIYFVISGFAFCRRNSETASQSAPNKYLQAAYRIIIALVMSSFIIVELFKSRYIYNDLSDTPVFNIIASYIFVVFIYLLYELLTTKKLKNLIRAIPGLGIVAVLNIAMFFGLSGVYKYSMSFSPAPDEINSVTMVSENLSSDSSWIRYSDYVLHQTGGLEISDKTVIEDVANALENNISMAESGIDRLKNFMYQEGSNIVSFKINTNGKSQCRNVVFNNKQYENLGKIFESNEKIREAWMKLPSLKDINDIYLYDGSSIGSIYNDDARELYSEFANEIKNADFETWFNECQMNTSESVAFFEVSYVIDGHMYSTNIPVAKSVAPNTAKKCYEIFKEKQIDSLKSLNDYLSDLEKSKATFNGDIYLYSYDNESGVDIVNQSYSFSNSLDVVYEVLDMRSGDFFDYDSYGDAELSYIEVNINFYDVSEPRLDGNGWSYRFPVDKQTMNKLRNIDLEDTIVD